MYVRPTKGLCQGIFLLIATAQAKPRDSLRDWVGVTRSLPTIMVDALDLTRVAELMLQLGLAYESGGVIEIHPELQSYCTIADHATLLAIGAFLLKRYPPPWLRTAIADGRVFQERIPVQDETGLEWLGEIRDAILVDAKNHHTQDDQTFQNWLGSLGENVVVSSELRRGHIVQQLSLVSDSLGYDVKSVGQAGLTPKI